MKNSVVIKSFPSGIVLHLDPDLPFDQLLADVGEKFRESSSFFKDAKWPFPSKDESFLILKNSRSWTPLRRIQS